MDVQEIRIEEAIEVDDVVESVVENLNTEEVADVIMDTPTQGGIGGKVILAALGCAVAVVGTTVALVKSGALDRMMIKHLKKKGVLESEPTQEEEDYDIPVAVDADVCTDVEDEGE